jgi:hypothetical protein
MTTTSTPPQRDTAVPARPATADLQDTSPVGSNRWFGQQSPLDCMTAHGAETALRLMQAIPRG